MPTMQDVKRVNTEHGFHWFEPSTMGFFGSKIETNLLRGRYFVTSEDNFNKTKRLFTIRKFDWATGVITDVPGFQQFATLKEAMEYLCNNMEVT